MGLFPTDATQVGQSRAHGEVLDGLPCDAQVNGGAEASQPADVVVDTIYAVAVRVLRVHFVALLHVNAHRCHLGCYLAAHAPVVVIEMQVNAVGVEVCIAEAEEQLQFAAHCPLLIHLV